MKAQHTIDDPVEIAGLGLFTGQAATLRFLPAPPDTGVVFVRQDQSQPVRIQAEVNNVAKRLRRTSIRNGSVQIETIEHCMAALAGLGIDNVLVELSGSEIPGLDGSSLPFVEKLKQAGIVEQDKPREVYRIPETVRVAVLVWVRDGVTLGVVVRVAVGAWVGGVEGTAVGVETAATSLHRPPCTV